MHYLLLTVTYAPEMKSGAFMLKALAEELQRKGNKVTVITFSSSIKYQYDKTIINGVKIIRIKIQDPGFNRIKRSLIELSYSRLIKEFLKQASEKKYSAVIYYSPSIFFGSAVKFIKKKWSIKSYLIMRDLFPDWTVKIGIMKKGLIYRFFKFFEKRQILAADFIGMESAADVEYCRKITQKTKISVEHLHNWVGEIQNENSNLANKYFSEDHINFIYGGVLGVAQDMISFLNLLSQMDLGKIRLVIVGQGEQKDAIEDFIIKYKELDIILLSTLDRSKYMDLVKASDVGLIVLNKNLQANNYPGKSLEYMYYSKPVFSYINIGNEFGQMISDYNFGYVIEGGDKICLQKNISDLINNREQRIEKGNNAKIVLDNIFSVERAAETITNKFN